MNRQPELIPDRSTSLECDGPELEGLLARLRGEGAIVLSLRAVCVARWRVCLSWPSQKTSKESFPAKNTQGEEEPPMEKNETRSKHLFHHYL